MQGIQAIIRGPSRNHFKWIYLKNLTLCLNILLHFYNSQKILNILKKILSFIALVFPKLSTP